MNELSFGLQGSCLLDGEEQNVTLFVGTDELVACHLHPGGNVRTGTGIGQAWPVASTTTSGFMLDSLLDEEVDGGLGHTCEGRCRPDGLAKTVDHLISPDAQ